MLEFFRRSLAWQSASETARSKTTRSTTLDGHARPTRASPIFFVWGERGRESGVRHGNLSIVAEVVERRSQSRRCSNHCRTRRAGMAVEARGALLRS